MIPASYLFKDIYRQHWEEVEVPVVVENRGRFLDGLLSPIAGAVTAVLHRRPAASHRRLGRHAYE